MGTDIHLYVEKRNEYREPGQPKWDLMMHEDAAWDHRNYDVFAVLADVRNGHGFAGCLTGSGFNVIAPPRGLPDDMSPEMARHAASGLEHTPSWLTLKEVLEFDWSQKVRKYGVVDAANFAAFEKNGVPDEWSGDVGGSGVEHVSPETMRRLIAEGKASGPPAYYTRVSWERTYEEQCRSFLEWCRGLVQECGWLKDGVLVDGETARATPKEKLTWQESGPFSYTKPEDIRFVFWFDS